MIGAIVYRLRALNSAKLSVTQGKLLHAAFFTLLRRMNPAVSTYIHDEMNIKPFTVSNLQSQPHIKPERGQIQVQKGQIFYWRVTAFHEIVLQAALAVPVNYVFSVGNLDAVVEAVMDSPKQHHDAGIIDENCLIAICMGKPDVTTITFRFVSPVTFRSFTDDYPMPLPEYILGSLADKWNQLAMLGKIDKEQIKERAKACCIPTQWEGKTERIYLSSRQGVTGFKGTFTFTLRHATLEEKHLFLLLAQFAVFAGVGRLSGQGLGQTRVTYK